MNYTRFITAASAARKPSAIRVMGESRPCSPTGGGGPRRAARGGLSPALRRPGTEAALERARGRAISSRERAGRCAHAVAASGHRSRGSAQRAGACGVGRAGSRDRAGCARSRAGTGRVENRFLLLRPLACLPDHSAFLDARVSSLVPPPVRSVHKKRHLLCFFRTSILSLEIVTF